MKRDQTISQVLLKELLEYNPDSGNLIWKHRDKTFFSDSYSYKVWNKRYAGKKAGGIDKRGSITLKIFDKSLSAARVIWILYYGEIPDKRVKYKNGNKLDLRLENISFV